ncbi:MAG: hypothetical protein IKM61_03205 [Eubacteriaceae bacterium]|nr:hypothetical protein [Eubacteriaceae bacterium]
MENDEIYNDTDFPLSVTFDEAVPTKEYSLADISFDESGYGEDDKNSFFSGDVSFDGSYGLCDAAYAGFSYYTDNTSYFPSPVKTADEHSDNDRGDTMSYDNIYAHAYTDKNEDEPQIEENYAGAYIADAEEGEQTEDIYAGAYIGNDEGSEPTDVVYAAAYTDGSEDEPQSEEIYARACINKNENASEINEVYAGAYIGNDEGSEPTDTVYAVAYTDESEDEPQSEEVYACAYINENENASEINEIYADAYTNESEEPVEQSEPVYAGAYTPNDEDSSFNEGSLTFGDFLEDYESYYKELRKDLLSRPAGKAPSFEEIKEYAAAFSLTGVDIYRFFDFYTQNDSWQKLRDWRKVLRSWHKKDIARIKEELEKANGEYRREMSEKLKNKDGQGEQMVFDADIPVDTDFDIAAFYGKNRRFPTFAEMRRGSKAGYAHA